MGEMRSRYLYLFAHLCHMPPSEVDRLTIPDFWLLATACEKTIQARKG